MTKQGPWANRRALRQRLREGAVLAAVGVFDALGAKVAANAGAEALYLGGFSAAAAHGLPDLGLLTQTEMTEHVARICQACPDRPLLVDADTGFGGPLNVTRTVTLFEAAGASAVQIEDQAWPKRCGHLDGKAVIAPAEMAAKLAAALAARRDPELMIVARTDALAVEGLAGAMERAHIYAQAGADALFVDAPKSAWELQHIADALLPLGLPLVFNAAPTGRGPAISRSQAAALGFRIVLHPVELLLAAYRAVEHAAAQLMADEAGPSIGPQSGPSSFDAVNQLLGVSRSLAAIDMHI